MIKEFKIPAKPTSVGEMLKEEFLTPLGLSESKLAVLMGVRCEMVNEICDDRCRLTTQTALLLSKYLGTTSEFWINLQLMNDIWKGRQC